ncbi:tpr repeat-containing protein [Grosmannia clavigera kw1407]|uniref:Tpr repeat-containing protein n=1 Tax=Grosmannia clavigera (strain kw1407 / UAMH 11150) TaxID=655863 RepID=F0X7K2_GROCL|nr:tpr repeat-containing protein [Grosmannia clavigera kw1407]EFX06572.1 tpr repeat-containing protein [Grosmannia clavigera kw1407]
MLRDVSYTLDRCERECLKTVFDELMKHVLIEAFMDLVKLWTGLIKYMRDNPQKADTISSMLADTPGKVEKSFAHLKAIASTSFGSELRRAPTLSEPLPDSIALPCGGAPYHDSRKFIGRENEIDVIHGELGPANMKDQRFCTIWGLAGMGKSKLAMEYAKRYEGDFYATLWISAQNVISIGQSFTNIAIDFGLQKATNGGKVDDNIRLVFNAIKKRGGNWLIIWDDVKEQATIRPHLTLNSKRVSTLVTTRYPEEAAVFRSRGTLLHLKKLSMDTSTELFERLLGPDNRYPEGSEDSRAAHVILQKMDGHPLGICTMATRIVAKNLSARGFLMRYRRDNIPVVPELADYEIALEAIWNESFQYLKDMKESRNGDCFDLLGVLSFCFPDAIPKTLFATEQPDDSEGVTPIFHDKQNRYEEACEMLRKSGLIDYDKDYTSITMHRVTQGAFLAFLGPEAIQSSFCLAASLIHRAFPKQVEGRSLHLQWDDCRTYIQHSNKLIKVYTESRLPHRRYQPLQPCEDFLELMANVCWYLVESGQDSECQRLSEIALKAVGPNTYRYAHLNNSLFAMSWFQNDLKSAFKYCGIAASSMKAHRPETSEEYLGILSNKASLLASDGKDTEALKLYLEVEETRKRYNYPQNIALAFINLGIGRLKSKMGEFDDAATRLEAARSIVQHEHGPHGKYMQQ